ncbi:MAG: hypothetical protein WDN04_03850 [Rhodospirillales bacterium]
MIRLSPFWLDARKGANAGLDALLFAVSVYGVPAMIGLVSILAFFSWDSQYSSSDSTPLSFRVIEQSGPDLAPAQALAQLAHSNPVQYFDTNRSEAPFWFSFISRGVPSRERAAIEFPSRHARDTRCWNVPSLSYLGEANRDQVTGWFEHAQAGSAVKARAARFCRHRAVPRHVRGTGQAHRRPVAGARTRGGDPEIPSQLGPARRRPDPAVDLRADHRDHQPRMDLCGVRRVAGGQPQAGGAVRGLGHAVGWSIRFRSRGSCRCARSPAPPTTS